MQAMGRNRVKKLRLKTQEIELELEVRDSNGASAYAEPLFDEENPLKEDFERHSSQLSLHEKKSGKEMRPLQEEDSSSLFVTSPMVGTVYITPSPQDASFVKVGDTITENSVVCVIEAMKVMNEVKSTIRGVVKEVLVQNGQPVDFGAKLFKISPV
jgi:acetyl-CoA carboxylase biotin carboxyl carrier protein